MAGRGPNPVRSGRATTGALTLVFYLSTLIYGCFEFVRTVRQNAFGTCRKSSDDFFLVRTSLGKWVEFKIFSPKIENTHGIDTDNSTLSYGALGTVF